MLWDLKLFYEMFISCVTESCEVLYLILCVLIVSVIKLHLYILLRHDVGNNIYIKLYTLCYYVTR